MRVLQHETIEPSLAELHQFAWGPETKPDIWMRWSQGFEFSPDEPTAFLQREGGPCAVIAPVQALLIKNFLVEGLTCLDDLRKVDCDKLKAMFLGSLKEMLQAASVGERKVVLVVQDAAKKEDSGAAPNGIDSEIVLDASELFHGSSFLSLDDADDLTEALQLHADTFTTKFGVLRFLYSILLTKGIDALKSEVEDSSEALIDGVHGHGSQSLINLFLTGKAVTNVWDNKRDIGGLCLQGIPSQNKIGFLTTLEHHRYCEVGSYLKNPLFPVWLMGSETHLTVLFSFDTKLTASESPRESALRIFKSYDPDGNGFIPNDKLTDVLSALDLVTEPGYVQLMQEKLDAEGLGIILRSAFMEEFFQSKTLNQERPRTFVVYHYNGLCRSCPDAKVTYQRGLAEINEGDLQMVYDATPVLLCMQTKWHGLDVHWHGRAPSLN